MTVKEEIIETIGKIGEEKSKFKSADIMAVIKNRITPQYLSATMSEMVESGQLLKEGGGRYTTYLLPKYAGLLTNSFHKKVKNDKVDEDQVLNTAMSKTHFLQKLHPNTKKIFDYAFTEMLNNAIEHSQSKFIDIEIIKSGSNLIFTIADRGIGVYKNVRSKKHLNSEVEAMQEILKGKTTTMPSEHSGEGIFFTSKVSDVFILESYGLRLRVDNLVDDIFYEEKKESYHGTKVTFIISLETTRTTSGIFFQYANDPEQGDFDKTVIHVKLYAGDSIYISRSQARRIMDGLSDKFRTIILDFDKVSTIGQAFADEVFRVFKLKHPEIEVKAINTNDVVGFMIERVEKL
jgi:anti-sigma regulatory factor (Ser/Thr protein kinase)